MNVSATYKIFLKAKNPQAFVFLFAVASLIRFFGMHNILFHETYQTQGLTEIDHWNEAWSDWSHHYRWRGPTKYCKRWSCISMYFYCFLMSHAPSQIPRTASVASKAKTTVGLTPLVFHCPVLRILEPVLGMRDIYRCQLGIRTNQDA